ncbi:MAG: hypothetical protein R3B47_20190 [Bacteroidia bacterium]
MRKQSFIPIELIYQNDHLSMIELEEPRRFHKNFDLNKLKVDNAEIEVLPMINPDIKTTEKILQSLTSEQKALLEVEDTFEIEFNEKLY